MSAATFYAALGVELPARGGREAPVRCFANPDAHAHEDRAPSASVNRDSGVWCCHACSAGGGPYDAALALGQAPADAMALLEEHGFKQRHAAQVAKPKREQPLATTQAGVEHYTRTLTESEPTLRRLRELRGWTAEAIAGLELGLDEQGRVIFPLRDARDELVGIVRYQPNAERRQGPKSKADPGSRRELFPPPESVESGDRFLLLVEGEPDAVAAASLDVPAVAVPGVAKWQRGWAERFAGRRVVVCLDSDEQGRRAAQERAQALVGHAAEVRVIDLDPSRTDGYDIGDWCLEASRNGGLASGRHALEQLVKCAEPLGRPSSAELGELLDDLSTFVRRFVVMSDSQAVAVALWIAHTHALDAADSTPYLGITSAEKRSGKTRLLEVLRELVARPLATSNISEAALFRSIAQDTPTLLFDELDAIFGAKAREREDLRAMVNAGHRRGAEVRRVGGANRDKLEAFPVFCAKALAGIGRLPETVADRSLPIRVERRAPDERVERGRLRTIADEATPLRERTEAWAAEHVDALRHATPDLPDELDDRAQDGSEPLLAIADLAGGDWSTRARSALVELHGALIADEDSLGVRLLADVRESFTRANSDRLSAAELIESLAADDEAPWADYRGKPLTNRALSSLLRRYGIKSRQVRFAEGTTGTAKGYLREQFEDAWSRYLPPTPASKRHNDTTRVETGETADFEATQDPFVSDSPEAANPHGDGVVSHVSDRNRGETAERDWRTIYPDANAAAPCACEHAKLTTDEDGDRRCLDCGRAARESA